jgi:hypothetical protein
VLVELKMAALPRMMHQNAMVVASLDPNGRGAVAAVANNI